MTRFALRWDFVFLWAAKLYVNVMLIFTKNVNVMIKICLFLSDGGGAVIITVAQNAISAFPLLIRFSRCFCSPQGTACCNNSHAWLLFSYYFDSLTIISRFAQLFHFPNNISARHLVDSYSLGEFPRLSLFQLYVCWAILSPFLRFIHHNSARHLVDSYSLGALPRSSLFITTAMGDILCLHLVGGGGGERLRKMVAGPDWLLYIGCYCRIYV